MSIELRPCCSPGKRGLEDPTPTMEPSCSRVVSEYGWSANKEEELDSDCMNEILQRREIFANHQNIPVFSC